MPKHFSDKEIEEIKKALKSAGEKHFSLFGLKRAKVEDIARDAMISKGSFYRFFDSKESLLIAILDDLETNVAQPLAKKIFEKNIPLDQKLYQWLTAQYDYLLENPLVLTIFKPEDYTLLIRRAGEKEMQEHMEGHNRFYFSLLMPYIESGVIDSACLPAIGSLLQMIFMLVIHKQEIGENFDSAFRLLIKFVSAGIANSREN